MPRLELTEPEIELLREIVGEWLSDLRMEIGATDNLSYRQELKRKESLVRGILDRLGAPVTSSSSP